MKKVIIYTDGSSRGNPGPGGYGAILLSGKHVKEQSGGYKKTTNNRMELMAVIVAIEALRIPSEVEVFSDSKYVINATLFTDMTTASVEITFNPNSRRLDN